MSIANARKAKCWRGHPFDDDNTYRLNARRYCRECGHIRYPAYVARKRARLAGVFSSAR